MLSIFIDLNLTLAIYETLPLFINGYLLSTLLFDLLIRFSHFQFMPYLYDWLVIYFPMKLMLASFLLFQVAT
jgi:hypothetical protein